MKSVYKITQLDLFSFAKFQAILLMLVGLLFGVVYAFGGFMFDLMVSLDWVETSKTNGLGFGTLLAFTSLIGMPITFGLLGFVLGVLEALLFNKIIGRRGGIRVKLNSEVD